MIEHKWTVGRIISWVLLALLIFISIFPLWIVLKTALTPTKEIFSNPGALFPDNPTLINFKRAMGLVSREENVAAGGSGESINFLLSIRNSMIFTTLVVVLQTFFSALAAYAFARLKFVGREVIFFLYLTALMIPGVILFIPNFILIKNLGWLETYQGMIAPFALFSPFGIFFLRQFFLSIPKELEEAAKLDGTSPFGTFWRIVLPTSTTPIATLVILSSIGMWNEYLWPWLVGRSTEGVRVLTVALSVYKSQTPQGAPDWTGLMAATFLSIIPIFVLLIIIGRKVVNSLQFSGLK
jgi:multiple sugar transport system permease protein